VNSRVVLFLCTGNYYRSRFAEILFNDRAKRYGVDWRATSRGLKIGWAGNVGSVSPETRAALEARRIRCATIERLPIECIENDLSRADLIVALKESEHRPLLEIRFAGWSDRVEYWDIHDVDQAPAAESLAEIHDLVESLIARLRRSSR